MQGRSRIIRAMIKPVIKLISALLYASCLLLALASQSHALVISGLYDHEVPVQGQGESERLRAYSEALAAVVVKVSGAELALQSTAVRRALRDAQSYVREVSYRTVSEPMPNTNLISIRFDPVLIDRLLADAGVTVWDKNRPSILLWLSVQGQDGRRELLAADSEHPIIALLQEYSRQRGVPILIPLMDFEDRRNLPVDIAWSLDEEAIRQASARYGADSVLSGRVLNSPSGDFVGLWQFLFKDSVEVFDSFEQNLSGYTSSALDRVSRILVANFAIDRSASATRTTVKMRVNDIKTAASYVALLAYVGDFAVVESADVKLLDGASVELEIKVLGSTILFKEFLSLGRDLVLLDEPLLERETGAVVLHYRWVR